LSTALQSIKRALRLIGVTAQGETPESEVANDALDALNKMLRSWNTQNLLVFGITIEEFSLTPGQSSYTLGSGGDFNTNIPIRTDAVFLRYGDNTEYPVQIIDNKYWGRLQAKSTSSSIPTHVYIDENFPLKTLHLYPTPSEAKTLIMHNYRKISSIASLSSALSFPDGYEDLIEYNLAIRLAPEYGKAIPAEIAKLASESMSNVKRARNKPVEIGVDAALLSHGHYFDWRSGQ
tara:strand:- start:17752 stop:18453 length:702 start_codon:yes stop_codon:yes gene_type:complete